MIGASSFMGIVAEIFIFGIIYLPCFVLLCYLIFHLIKHFYRGVALQIIPGNEADRSLPTERQPLLKPPTTSVVTLKDCAEDDGYADRMINPSRYNTEDAL